jgi:hypothetical protein
MTLLTRPSPTMAAIAQCRRVDLPAQLRYAAATLRPGLRVDEFGQDEDGSYGWWTCTSALTELGEPDAALAGMFYSAMGCIDDELRADRDYEWRLGSPVVFERQCVRFMYLELLACIAETDPLTDLEDEL